MTYILQHPDVKTALQGKRTHNLFWHWRRTSLGDYLERVEKTLPEFAKFLWTCVKGYRKNSPTDGASLINSLVSQSKTNSGILSFEDVRSKRAPLLQKGHFITYVLSVRDYGDYFHCGKHNQNE
jgi:hypothetical protein